MPNGGSGMSEERTVKVFRNGRNRAIRIPREFEFPGDQAVIRREGRSLVIEPAAAPSLLAVLAKLKPLKEAFPPIPDKPPGAVAI
jgi:antitoxin VapB